MTKTISAFIYHYWSALCVPAAVALASYIWHSYTTIPYLHSLIYALSAFYCLYLAEVYFWPGGFKEFINKHVFHSPLSNMPLSEKNIFLVNAPLLLFILPVIILLSFKHSIYWATLLTVYMFLRAALHIAGALIKKCYHSGLITSIFLLCPSSLYMLYQLWQANQLSIVVLLVSIVVAVLIHLGMVVFIVHTYKDELMHIMQKNMRAAQSAHYHNKRNR